MTNRQPTSKAGWWRFFLAALAAVRASMLAATTASAATLTAAETRVGTSTLATVHVVGVDESVSAGQRWVHAPPAGGFGVRFRCCHKHRRRRGRSVQSC